MISFFEKMFSAITATIVSFAVSLGLISTSVQPPAQIAIDPPSVIQEQALNNQQQKLPVIKTLSQQPTSPQVPASKPAPVLKQNPALTPEPVQITTPPPTQAPITPTSTQVSSPQPAPEPTPTPTISEPVPAEISIQNQVCNLSQTNLKTEYQLYDLLQNSNIDGRIFLNAYVLNNSGQNYYNSNPPVVMTITTSNHSNDKTLNGSGNTGPCGYYYPYEFYAMQAGTYTITYSVPAFNLSKTITLNIKLPEKPIIESKGITVSTPEKETDFPISEIDNISTTSSIKYWFETSKPNYQYSISAWCSDNDTAFLKIDMVSHLEKDGLYYYRGYFLKGNQFLGATTCKFIHSADSSITIFSESDPVTFNVK